MLLMKLRRANDGLDSTQPAFSQLTDSCIQRSLPVHIWGLDEQLAMSQRGDHLKIYDLNHDKAPSLAEITLQLSENDAYSGNGVGATAWIASGIKAENEQLVLSLFPCYPYTKQL